MSHRPTSFKFQHWHWGILLLVLIGIGSAVVQWVPQTHMGDVPEVDESQKLQTIAHELSSYAQSTNHMPYFANTKEVMANKSGIRVNQFFSSN
jgi:hypothetical protein